MNRSPQGRGTRARDAVDQPSRAARATALACLARVGVWRVPADCAERGSGRRCAVRLRPARGVVRRRVASGAGERRRVRHLAADAAARDPARRGTGLPGGVRGVRQRAVGAVPHPGVRPAGRVRAGPPRHRPPRGSRGHRPARGSGGRLPRLVLHAGRGLDLPAAPGAADGRRRSRRVAHVELVGPPAARGLVAAPRADLPQLDGQRHRQPARRDGHRPAQGRLPAVPADGPRLRQGGAAVRSHRLPRHPLPADLAGGDAAGLVAPPPHPRAGGAGDARHAGRQCRCVRDPGPGSVDREDQCRRRGDHGPGDPPAGELRSGR